MTNQTDSLIEKLENLCDNPVVDTRRKEAYCIYRYAVNDCINIIRQHAAAPDERTKAIQIMRDNFILGNPEREKFFLKGYEAGKADAINERESGEHDLRVRLSKAIATLRAVHDHRYGVRSVKAVISEALNEIEVQEGK